MESKRSFAGLASFIALTVAAIIFIIEYSLGMTGTTWANYLLIVKDIAVAIGIIFASLHYVRHSGWLVKLLFIAVVITYIVFAVLTQIQ